MKHEFRPEVQALRALAVMLVVTFHLWPHRVPGGYIGVDVFFVISGFLITSHLARELLATNGIKLRGFYARRIRRLLPAAFFVLGVALIASFALARTADLSIILRDVLASALYSVNWVLAASSVDYFAADDAVSPVQHYWSLAVEEQFYLLWPLILLLAWIPRRLSVVYATLTVVFITCFVYSIWGSIAFQSFAYFATPAHGWEFAAGGLLALFLRGRSALGGLWAALVSWAGWGAIVSSAFLFTAASPFPGWIALLPVVGTLAVLVAGAPQARWSPAAVASWKPVQFTGDVSYSLYLWHFPPIILLTAALDRDLVAVEKLLILLACFVLAWLTKRYIEDPVRVLPRLQTPKLTFLAAAGATAVLVIATVLPALGLSKSYADGAQEALEVSRSALEGSPTPERTDAECFGALASIDPLSCPGSRVPLPGYGPEFAAADNFDTWSEQLGGDDPYFVPDCATVPGTGISECWYRSGVEDAFTVAIPGDSHAGHWLPAILTLGRENGWDVIRYRESGCRLALEVYDSTTPHGLDCRAWKEDIVPYLERADWVDLAVVSASVNSVYLSRANPPSVDEFAQGFLRVWEPWLRAGKKIVVMSDGPGYPVSVPGCVESAMGDDSPCSVPRRAVAFEDPLLVAAAAIDEPGFGSYDTMQVLCDETLCHPVVGGLITHKDGGHIAASFMVTMAPLIAPTIEQVAPEAFEHPLL